MARSTHLRTPAVVAVLATMLLVGEAGPAEAAFPGENGLIVFTSSRVTTTNPTGDSEIFAMNPDGTNPTRLTKNAAWDGVPAVSPDGKRTSFVTTRHGGFDQEELYVMDARDADGNGNGDNPLRLTNDTSPDFAPAFSPDGKKLVFGTDRDLGTGKEELYTMDVADSDGDGNGDDLLRLTNDATANYFPDWGPVIPPPGCTIVGTAGKDVILASQSPGSDTICTLGGDDQVNSGGGKDTAKGGGGIDTLVGGDGSDRVYGESGDDKLNVKDGVSGNDLADGGSGTDACARDSKDKLVSCP